MNRLTAPFTNLLNTYGWEILAIPSLFGLCFGMLGWALFNGLRDASTTYDDVYASEAARELENLFLFIPPNKIARIARTLAYTLFIGFFFLFADILNLTFGGVLRGLTMGAIAAFSALMAPRLVISFLKKRRLHKFNLQLVDALVGMSNSLKAGFSIGQAFEQVVKEGQNPIAQEFSVFLQQTRIGVRFDDALENLDERVGSEDLTLMVRSVETARQTGGNLTEVFEKMAQTIRERMRLEGKIKAMTAMGRLQGIVVGLIPVMLLFAMTALDPQMMSNFFASIHGIGLLILVGVLEIVGFIVIKKIVTIKV